MLTISLELPTATASKARLPDLDPDDYASLVMEACEVLGRTDCKFHMGGFGLADWALDVAYDLSAVVEQLPDVLDALRAGIEAELDIYTQGVERALTFSPAGDSLRIRCRSGTSWSPRPDSIHQGKSSVVRLMESLATDFAEAINLTEPRIGGFHPFVEWRRGRV